jgi:phosphoketolase
MQQPASESEKADVPNRQELSRLDAYWRAANYLSVGQIYLLDNPLLREPLKPEHIKPRLLGHWGTTPGLNFIYAHLNRVIKALGSATPRNTIGTAFVCRRSAWSAAVDSATRTSAPSATSSAA